MNRITDTANTIYILNSTFFMNNILVEYLYELVLVA